MSCCTNTYDLGCIYYCNQLKFAESTFSGSVVGVFSNSNHAVSQNITVENGEPFMFDMSYLNENMDYTLKMYNEGVLIELTIDDIVYDCFSLKTETIGIAVSFTPLPDVQDGVLVITATGVEAYTNASLIGKTLLIVSIDNLVRIPSEYSFNTLTGTITFNDYVDTGSIIQILYK